MPPSPEGSYGERWSSADGRQRWRHPILSARVRAFCEPCNTGWMSQIESAAKPIVGPMVRGITTTLDAAAQETVANFVVVKGLVAVQGSRTPQPIPDSHYRRVWAAEGAPANTVRVWIGERRSFPTSGRPSRATFFDSHFMPVTNAARPFPMPRDFSRYISEGGVFNGTIFQLGHFFGLAIQHDWPGLQVRPEPGSDAERALIPIWPTDRTVKWPPSLPVDVLGDAHKVTRFLQMAPPQGSPPIGP